MNRDTTRDMTHDTTDDNGEVVTVTEAAARLGMSVRTVQRKLDAGELQAVMRLGKRAVLLPGDLPLEGVVTDGATDDTAAVLSRGVTRGESNGLNLVARRDKVEMQPAPSALEVLSRLADAIEKPAQTTVQEIGAKLLLSLDDCRILTGLSRATLRAAIEAGELKAGRVGRAFRVRPDDLRKFLDGLF